MKYDIRRILLSKVVVLQFIMLLLLGTAWTKFDAYVENASVMVTLNEEGHQVEILTMESTVGDLLDKYRIELRSGDEINPRLDEQLQEGTVVKIKRAITIIVQADKNEQPVHMVDGTVANVLEKAGISLSGMDELNYELSDPITPAMIISITRVVQQVEVEEEAIPYGVVVKRDNAQDEGQRRVVQQGRQGELHRKFTVLYRDGREVSRKLVEEKIAEQPIDRIVMEGTVRRKITSRGDVVRYAFSLVFEATAYTHTGNPTRTGVMPKVGHIAVDPKVIPLNSTVYLDFSGRWNRLDGFYKAVDTGGVIDGDIVDVFMNTEEEAIQFGRRRVTVYLVR